MKEAPCKLIFFFSKFNSACEIHQRNRKIILHSNLRT